MKELIFIMLKIQTIAQKLKKNFLNFDIKN